MNALSPREHFARLTRSLPRLPAHETHECTVLFEDEHLVDIAPSAFTWRATVAYTDQQNWFVQAVDLPTDYRCKDFADLPREHPLWLALVDRTTSDAIRPQVEAAIAARSGS